MITIYHNPRCGKSRECLAFLDKSNQEYEVVKYLEIKFTFETLSDVLKKLKISPIDLVRTKEKLWIENFRGKTLSNDEIISAMVQNPILIERPIAVKDDKAVIARPFENVKALF
jgi:arsenate reductase